MGGTEMDEDEMDVVNAFLENPNAETGEALRNAALAWEWDTICGQLGPDNLRRNTDVRVVAERISVEADRHVASRLNAVINANAGNITEMTEYFVIVDEKEVGDIARREGFQQYVTAVALFYCLKVEENPDRRQRLADFLRYQFVPFCENWLTKRRFSERVRQGAVERLKREPVDHMTDPNKLPDNFEDLVKNMHVQAWQRAINEYRSLRAARRNGRPDPRAPQVLADEQHQDLLDDELDLPDRQPHIRGIGGHMEPEAFPGNNEIEANVAVRMAESVDALYPLYCEAAANFNNDRGRRLFLWLILGGLAHTIVDALRNNNDAIRYLLQPNLINTLLNAFGAMNNVFAVPVHRATVEKVDELMENNHHDQFDYLENNRGWKVLNRLSDYRAGQIRVNHLVPNVDEWNDAWVAHARVILGNAETRTPEVVAGLTRFLCGNQTQNGNWWRQRLADFA
jgi:hypothetical protein